MSKRDRHKHIVEVIRSQRVTSQEALREMLTERGIEVTQATLSRDIRELRLVKVPGADGVGFYSSPEEWDSTPSLESLLPTLFHSAEGDAIWQWGQHLDFQSVMIVYPEHGFGAVVCTNNDLINADVAIEIAHRMLGGDIEPIRRAIHLQYNYRGRE